MQLPLFDPMMGIIILAVYALVVYGLTSYFSRGYASTKEAFLLSRRDLSTTQGSLSVAAAWLWAAGLFISAQQAYVNGLVGLFWFSFGAILTYWLFGWFAQKLRDRYPDGFTFSSYIKETYSARVQNIYIFEMVILAVSVFALNLLAGGKIVELLTGLNYYVTVPVMAAIALLYSFRGGLKASVITEIFKIIMVWFGVLLIVGSVMAVTNGWDTVVAGLGGIKGDGASIIGTDKAWTVFVTFGLATFLGQMGAFFGDNAFYQRAFSVPKQSVFQVFAKGSIIYGVIPIAMGLLGFLAAGSNLIVPKGQEQMVNAFMIAQYLPSWVSILFVFVVFAGLISVLDSQFSSVASMAGHDIYKKFKSNDADQASIGYARWGMVIAALLGIGIAFIPGITLLHIFLFFATLRASVWLPSMVAVLRPQWFTEKGLFHGMLLALVLGIPTFVYGSLIKNSDIALTGTLIAILGSFVFSWVFSKKQESISIPC